MSGPVVNVVIDTCNFGQWVEHAIKSAPWQDFPLDQVEIRLVNDGSTDDTAERVESMVRAFGNSTSQSAGRPRRSTWVSKRRTARSSPGLTVTTTAAGEDAAL